MPKRTKKDKLKAAVRRTQQAEKLVSYKFVKPQSVNAQEIINKDGTATLPMKINTAVNGQTTLSFTDNLRLKKDLLKILAFTVLAVIFQVVIYYFHRG